ncbi:conserved domain protein [Bacteroides fluxus YIT 12057]|uniref:Conserved domain protein n=1 Tax=Bacteroides fluxus YIT 12057 TaxID=763034 RepID=F3PYU6_9BACE|nr:conserved domain protein [Bacteroides fluxus YIT 12057]
MGSLFVILPDKVVREEGLAASRRSEYELVAVGDDSLPHGQVADVQVDRNTAPAVCHADAERTGRAAVVRLRGKQADGLLQEGMETFLGRKVTGISGNARPVEYGGVNRVVTGDAAHQGKLASGIVLDAPEFLAVIRPGQHVAVAAYGKQSLGMGFVQKHFRPFMVDGIAPAVPGQGQHVA